MGSSLGSAHDDKDISSSIFRSHPRGKSHATQRFQDVILSSDTLTGVYFRAGCLDPQRMRKVQQYDTMFQDFPRTFFQGQTVARQTSIGRLSRAWNRVEHTISLPKDSESRTLSDRFACLSFIRARGSDSGPSGFRSKLIVDSVRQY